MGIASPEHILLLALIIGLLFGSRRLPTIGRRAGRAVRETREALSIDQIRNEFNDARAPIDDARSSVKDARTSLAEATGHAPKPRTPASTTTPDHPPQ